MATSPGKPGNDGDREFDTGSSTIHGAKDNASAAAFAAVINFVLKTSKADGS